MYSKYLKAGQQVQLQLTDPSSQFYSLVTGSIVRINQAIIEIHCATTDAKYQLRTFIPGIKCQISGMYLGLRIFADGCIISQQSSTCQFEISGILQAKQFRLEPRFETQLPALVTSTLDAFQRVKNAWKTDANQLEKRLHSEKVLQQSTNFITEISLHGLRLQLPKSPELGVPFIVAYELPSTTEIIFCQVAKRWSASSTNENQYQVGCEVTEISRAHLQSLQKYLRTLARKA